MICLWGAGLGRREELEGGAEEEEEEAEDRCRRRRWPHAGLVGNDKCFPTGKTPRTQGMGWPGGGRQMNKRPEDLGRGHTMPPKRLHLWGCYHRASCSSKNSSEEDWGKLERCQGRGISWPGCWGH